jgi:hypothetical protein
MREIRPYGSVRGVRRKPYPYRDTPNPMRSSVLFASVVARAAGDDHRRVHGPPRRSKAAPRGTACGWIERRLREGPGRPT